MRQLSIVVLILVFVVSTSALAEREVPGAPETDTPVSSMSLTCEDYESGFTLGQTVGSHAGWFDGGAGPVVTAGVGVNGSVGLAAAPDIFTWTSQGFNWNDPGFEWVILQMDFESNSEGIGNVFNGDRVGWMIRDDDNSSDHIFGVQFDDAENNIEGYWDGASGPDKRFLITTWSPKRDTWYRLWVKVTKLTATSARLDVTVHELASDGTVAVADVAGGVIADTNLLGDDVPNTKYFTASEMWPGFKNSSGDPTDGAADNACVEVSLTPPPLRVTCEDYESGFTLGQTVGSHADWFDNGNGPVVTAGVGVNGSVGLAAATNIFTWTSEGFDWNDPEFEWVILQMDFESNSEGIGNVFNGDRVGWMIRDDDNSSSHIFGVQFDDAENKIEGYWDGVSGPDKRPLITTWSPKRDTWYKLWVQITKLTATSARLDVRVHELASDGTVAVADVAGGTIADTDLLGDDVPDTKYFTASEIWPGYKNSSGEPTDGAADNACVEVRLTPPPPMGCEDYESGFTLGQTVGSHADWFDGGNGPVVTAGAGVNGSVGLAQATNIFTWTSQGFAWTDWNFEWVILQMDFESNSEGTGNVFNGNRVGWMIRDDNFSSDHIFGVQFDDADNKIEGYWDGASGPDKRPLITTWSPKRDTWYRLWVKITKLTVTSARLDVTVHELASDGTVAVADVAGGVIADTDLLGDDVPNTKYFTASEMWPGFKNSATMGDGAADNACVEVSKRATGVGDDVVPRQTALQQNSPNPFNPTTTIRYTLADRGWVSLRVYNVSGRLVRTLVDGAKGPGEYEQVWDGLNNRGESVATGVYFYRLHAGKTVLTRKAVLLK